MPFWFALILFAASTILGQLFRPKTSQPKPGTLADLDFPTAEETRAIPKGYGTFEMKAPNVVSVTDFSSEVMKSKVGAFQLIASFGLAKKQTIGFKYFCGIEMALSYRLDAITKITIGEKVAWSGNMITDGEVFINQPNLFGGSDPNAGGNGGVVGYLGMHLGLPNAVKDSYLASEYGNYSAHRGIAYLVWKGQHRAKGSGYLGNSTQVSAWKIEGRFIPNNLPYGTYGFSNRSNINNGDANPAEVMYDIIRNSEYAIGLDESFIDVASFTKCANTFYNDGYGFSALWDSAKPCKDVIIQMLQYTDSVLYTDLQTGRLTLKAARADYVIADLPSFTDKDIISITSYTRGAWAETTNEVKIPFIDRTDAYVTKPAIAQDLANQRIQGVTISTNVQHTGISNPATGAKVAQRDLRALCTPLAKVVFQVNLKAYLLTPGAPFLFSTKRILDHTGAPITNLVMRCTGTKAGSPINPVLEIEGVEDLFNTTASVYASPPASGGSDTSVAPVATDTSLVDELPLMLASNDAGARLWTMAKAPNAGSYSFDLYTSDIGTAYQPDDSNNSFTPTGVLTGAYNQTTNAIDATDAFIVAGSTSSNLTRLGAATAVEIANGANLMLVVEGGKVEIMAYESFIINGTGDYVFHNVWRGLLDTTPQSFTAAARVWFFSEGDARGNAAFGIGTTGYAKILTRTLQGILDETAAAAITRVMGVRALRPYAPGNIRINGAYNGAIPASGDITIAWSHRDRLRQAAVISQAATGVAGIEGGARYVLKIYNQAGTLIRTVSDLITESYTYTNALETTDNGALASALSFVLYTQRDGITSYEAQIRTSARSAGAVTVPTYVPSGIYTAPAAGNATSIGGVAVTGTPDGTNTTPVYNPATGTITWQPGGGGSVTIREIDGNSSGVANTIEVPNGQLTQVSPGVFRITPLQGVTGAAGSVWYVGAGVPGNSLGVDNDMYLRDVTGDVYRKIISVWSIVANIKGVAGNPGSAGNPGAAGSAGVAGGGYANIIRSSVQVLTPSLAPNANAEITAPLNKSFAIIRISTNKPARIRVYSTSAYRSADAGRALGALLAAGSENGLIAEIVTTAGNLSFDLSPAAFGSDLAAVPTGSIPIIVENLDNSAGIVAVIFDFLGLEGQSATGVRNDAVYTTANLAANASESTSVQIDKGFVIYRIITDRPARVRLYSLATYRDADAARPIGTDVTGESGLICEVVTTAGNLSLDFAPLAVGADMKSAPDGLIAAHITNLDAGAGTVTVTISKLKTEG